MQTYLLAFCRIAIGVTFAYSFLAKLRNIDQFAITITNFRLLTDQLSKPAAILLLIGELAIILLMMVGSHWLIVGFSLATLLLFVFTMILAWVLARSIQTPCYCFGTGNQAVMAYDLWRNGGFALCAAVGWIISCFGDVRPLNWLEWGIIIVPALVFVMAMTHLGEITALFQPAGEK